jgi:hypothetical protein
VFENRVLRRIFRLKRDEMMGRWRKLHNEELLYLFFILVGCILFRLTIRPGLSQFFSAVRGCKNVRGLRIL